MDQVNEHWTWFEELVAHHYLDRSWDPEREPLAHSDTHTYGTLSVNDPRIRRTRKKTARLTVIIATSSFLLWVAQWLFWSGLISLSAEEFCPPNIYLVTAIWIGASVAVAQTGGGLRKVECKGT
ncbi:hypothetical protein PMIN07_009981 [Paraphaeosphaeria minitans]